MPSKPKPPPLSRWLIVRIGGPRAARLGTVEARTAEEAVEVAAELFGIPEEQRKRIAATRIAE